MDDDIIHLVLALNRIQLRTVENLLTEHDCLSKCLHTIGVFKYELVCRLCNEEKEIAYHVVFE